MTRITVVNDNPEFLELMDEVLEDERYDTTTIDGDRATVLEEIRESRADLLIIDIRLGVPGDRGWEIAKRVRDEPAFAEIPILLCCTDPVALQDMAAEIAAARRVETLPKPFSIEQLLAAIDRLIGHASPR